MKEIQRFEKQLSRDMDKLKSFQEQKTLTMNKESSSWKSKEVKLNFMPPKKMSSILSPMAGPVRMSSIRSNNFH